MEKTKANYYQELHEMTSAVGASCSISDLLNRIAERVTKALGAKGSSVMLLSPDGKVLVHAASHGLSDSYLQKGPVLADRNIAEVFEGKLVTILYAANDDRVQYRDEAKREGIASILSVPLILGAETIGVLRVYTTEIRDFDADSVYFLSTVAGLCALALDNARFRGNVPLPL